MLTAVHYARRYGCDPIRTACGRNGWLDGGAPLPGHPAEYNDEMCNRFEATPHAHDVTCKRCLPAALKYQFEESRR